MQFKPHSPDQPYIVLGLENGAPMLLFANSLDRSAAETLASTWLKRAKHVEPYTGSQEARVVRNFGIGLLEAMFKRRNLTLPAELFDLLTEWIELPEVQVDDTVRELVEEINKEGERVANAPYRTPSRAERRKFKR